MKLSRRALAVAGAVLVLVLAAITAVALAQREPAVRTEILRVPGVPEAGGAPVTLDATLYLPDLAGPLPAVLLAHGFGGSTEIPAE